MKKYDHSIKKKIADLKTGSFDLKNDPGFKKTIQLIMIFDQKNNSTNNDF